MKFLLGQKMGMSQIFTEEGEQIPVTVVEAGPCKILQVKDKEKDGYEAVQIGFDKLKEKKVKKTQKNKPFRFIREFRVPEGEDISQYKEGEEIKASVFQEGDKVDVSGRSKGKGFQGGVKKWGFHGRPTSHGTKHEVRKIGSIGSTPLAKVWKGKKMPGRMGNQRVTIKKLEVVKVEPEKNLLMLKGAVPGKRGTFLELKEPLS
ncbi:MAG: 50S ribosomal protein L3 [Candidatus Nealsonbacteria bacterium]|nr:50S ribosomal protein L3 [Candidatus Nealsonbacteria bacterium]